jgi:hypothetical protein
MGAVRPKSLKTTRLITIAASQYIPMLINISAGIKSPTVVSSKSSRTTLADRLSVDLGLASLSGSFFSLQSAP